MYNPDMKLLIKYALELDINNIRTFSGYKGGDILSFSSNSREVIQQLRTFCHRLEVTTNIKQSKDHKEYEIFCEFGIDRFSVDDDIIVYDLK